MDASLWIQRDLRLISKPYFAVYSEPHKRWMVRKWTTFHIPKLGSTRDWQGKSNLILVVRKEDYIGNDIGYQDLDMRVIKTIQEGLYHARNMKQLVQEVDRANDKKDENFSINQEAMARELATRLWHKFQEPTIYLSGKSWQ